MYPVRQRRIAWLALVATLLLALLPAAGRIFTASSTTLAVVAMTAHDGAMPHDGGAPAHSAGERMPSRHDDGGCDYCVLQAGAGLPTPAVTAVARMPHAPLSLAPRASAPAAASSAWTLGSRGPPRVHRA
ncbi:DUF2946 family protein [Lysobacter xanthus]